MRSLHLNLNKPYRTLPSLTQPKVTYRNKHHVLLVIYHPVLPVSINQWGSIRRGVRCLPHPTPRHRTLSKHLNSIYIYLYFPCLSYPLPRLIHLPYPSLTCLIKPYANFLLIPLTLILLTSPTLTCTNACNSNLTYLNVESFTLAYLTLASFIFLISPPYLNQKYTIR